MADLNLKLRRLFKGPDYTIGKLYQVENGKDIYLCDILEDTVRNKIGVIINKFVKIFGKTAIPYGKYQVIRTYSNRFERILPELLNVPKYTAIRIHPGNDAMDTDGCLLTGKNTVKGKVTNSKFWFAKVDTLIEEALREGKCWIEITD